MPSELEAFRGTALLVIIMKAGMLSGINIELSSTPLIWIGLRDRLGMYPQCLFSRMFLKSDQGRASTYLSTRAFLSTLLSRSPTLQTTSSSYPFMFPGVDILNHSRGQTVSWCTSYPEGSTEARDDPATISIISHITTPLGEEVFNNYGLKANLQPPIYLYFNRCVSYSRPAMTSLHNLRYSARTTVFSFLHHSCSFFGRTVPHVKLSKHLISVACVYRSLRSSNFSKSSLINASNGHAGLREDHMSCVMTISISTRQFPLNNVYLSRSRSNQEPSPSFMRFETGILPICALPPSFNERKQLLI